MEILRTTATVATIEADALIVGVYQDGRTDAADWLDQENGGVIGRLVELEEFKPEVGKLLPLYCPAGIKAPVVAVVGLGARAEMTPGAAFRACGAATRWLTERNRRCIGAFADGNWSPEIQESALAGAAAGCYGPGLYQAQPKRFAPAQLLWNGVSAETLAAGTALGAGINLTRRLVNEPPDVLYPESFAERAEEVARATGMTCEVWDDQRLREERCGALLAVAQGSARPARLVILTYQGGAPTEPPLALVGKGVTFDSGGLSLKPTDGMLTMKCDMAGAATVLGAMQVIAQQKLPVNVIGLMGLVENMPSANAFKLGDVLHTRSGKTIEVHNTDAEGRLVLADVLSVAVDRGAARIVDLATLTGACMIALGTDVVGAMSNDQAWCDQVLSAAQRTGERMWQLPMFPEYGEQIKSPVADMKNVGEGRWGGAITAAKLLEEFVAGKPWVHLDIAGPAFLEKPKPWLDPGGSGVMVRTLLELMRGLKPPADGK